MQKAQIGWLLETESDLLDQMTANLPTSDWRTKTVHSFTPAAITQRLMPCFKFSQQFWGLRRMESWLGALEFPSAWKEKLLRMALDPTQQETVKKASITFKSSNLPCSSRWQVLGLSTKHATICGDGGCTKDCVVKICSGSAKTTQIGAPNDAALTNRLRPMIVCTDWKHNAFEKPPKHEGG